MSELEKAIETIKAHGYFVIPRERVLAQQSIVTVQNVDLQQYRSEAGYMDHLIDRHTTTIAKNLRGRGILHLESFQAPNFCTEFRATIKLLPHEVESDPFLEEIRRLERRK